MINVLERSKGNVLGFDATGEISPEDIESVEVVADKAITEYGKINWLIRMDTSRYTSLRAMYEDMMWLVKNLRHFDKMAVVGDKKWEELLVKADGLVFGEKYFDVSQLEEAWKYVES